MNKAAKQTLALASIFQTTALVHQLASTGQCDSHSNKASLNSIVSQSDDIDEIFSSPEDLRVGFESLKTLLEKKPISMQNIMLYSTALINLEKKFVLFFCKIFEFDTFYCDLVIIEFFKIAFSFHLFLICIIYSFQYVAHGV